MFGQRRQPVTRIAWSSFFFFVYLLKPLLVVGLVLCFSIYQANPVKDTRFLSTEKEKLGLGVRSSLLLLIEVANVKFAIVTQRSPYP